MTVTVYASENIDADTLSAGVAVMAAMRGDENFPENFTAHPAIAHADQEGDVIRFIPDLAGLSSPVTLTLYKGNANAVEVSVPAGVEALPALKTALAGKAPSGGNGSKDPSPGA
ncbi:MAG: hypothetical protein EP349_04330 [Alphaproteobacteria bacterium]|nr:MAG: hypothetical protein EP349_04330 [Alphaproteobacteria bacterium]